MCGVLAQPGGHPQYYSLRLLDTSQGSREKVAFLWMVMVETESNGNTISFGSGTTGLVIHIFGVTAHQT